MHTGYDRDIRTGQSILGGLLEIGLGFVLEREDDTAVAVRHALALRIGASALGVSEAGGVAGLKWGAVVSIVKTGTLWNRYVRVQRLRCTGSCKTPEWS